MRTGDTTTTGETPGRLSRARTVQLTGAGLSLIAACYGLARFAYGLFVPVFRSEFALGAGAAGAIAAGSYASYGVALVVTTLATPRFGGRVVAVAAGAVATLGLLVVAAAPNSAVLAVGVLVAGSSTGVASPPLAHAVAHSVRTSARDRVQTVINAGTGVGVAVAGPVALVTHEHWRAAWSVFAILCAAVTVWVAFTVPPGPGGRAHRSSAATLLPHPLLPGGSGRLIAAAVLTGVASSAVWTFGRDILVDVGGLSETSSTLAWIFLGVFGVLGATAGDLVRRLGLRAAWVSTTLAMGLATVLLVAFPHLAWVATSVFGAAYIALTGLLLLWGTEVHEETPAAGVGLAFLALAVGQGLGAPLVGALLGSVGPLATFIAAGGVALVRAVIRPAL